FHWCFSLHYSLPVSNLRERPDPLYQSPRTLSIRGAAPARAASAPKHARAAGAARPDLDGDIRMIAKHRVDPDLCVEELELLREIGELGRHGVGAERIRVKLEPRPPRLAGPLGHANLDVGRMAAHGLEQRGVMRRPDVRVAGNVGEIDDGRPLFRELSKLELGAELEPAAPKLVGVEALHDGGVFAARIAVALERLEHARREIDTMLPVKRRRLDFRIDTYAASGRRVERAHEAQLLVERRDPELDVIVGEAAGEYARVGAGPAALDDA